MADKPKNYRNPGESDLRDTDPVNRKSELNSGNEHTQLPVITDEEIEEALENVHRRIGVDDTTSPPIRSISGRFSSRTLLLAAAALLLAGLVSSALLLVPVEVHVPAARQITLTLPDGSTVELNSESSLRYNRLYGYTNRSLTLDGEGYFEIESGRRAFMLEANGAMVEVTGTSFNVRSRADASEPVTTVTLLSGKLLFYPLSDPGSAVELAPGRASSWSRSLQKPEEPVTTQAARAIAWRERNLAFTNQPLSSILRELERTFDLTIELDDPAAGSELLTTFYSEPRHVEPILRDICTVKGLTFSRTATGYRIYTPSHGSPSR